MKDFTSVNRPPAEAQSYYDSLAAWYDLLASSEKKFILQGVDLLDPRPGQAILEIGFGTGFAQGRITEAVGDGLSAGVDLSPRMAEIALKKLRRAGLNSRTGLVCSNSIPLPFADQSFDSLFSSFTLELFDTPAIPELLGECRRVLKPGGRLVIVSLSKDQPLPWMGRLYEAFHNKFPTIADCRPIPVRALLERGSYTLLRSEMKTMWGIPVILAEARTAS